METSYNPKVSLDPKVHYTTQESKYELLAIGVGDRLTNSRIHYWELRGKYGRDRQAAAEAREREAALRRKRSEERQKRKSFLDSLTNLLVADLTK